MRKRLLKPLPGNKFLIENNGKIEFTYVEAEKVLGIPQASFWRGIKRLLELGLIDIPKQGAGMKGDKNLFAFTDRWEKYATPNFIHIDWKKDIRSIHLTPQNWSKRLGRSRKKKQKKPTKLSVINNQ